MIGINWKSIKGPLLRLGTITLWLLSSALALWEILVVRALMVRVTTGVLVRLAGLSEIRATVWGYRVGAVATLFMAIFALVIVLGGLDARQDRIGKYPAWKVLLWLLGGQVAIFGIAYIFS